MAQARGRRGGDDPARPGPRADRRLRAWVLAVLVVLSLFGGRLVQLQGTDATELAAAALAGRTIELHPTADRGDVVDAEGVQLATSVERRDVVVDPTLLRVFNQRSATDPTPVDPALGTGFAGAAAELAKALGGTPQAIVDVLAPLPPTARYAKIAKELTPEAWRRVQALEVPGVYSERTSLRVYPAGAAASTLVGVLGSAPGDDGEEVTKGVSGVERAFDEELRGRDGYERYERSASGQQIPLGETESEPAVDGDTLHLTVDRDLQWKAQEAIAAKVAETGALNGTVVVMDKEQRVLAMASAPSVDPADRSRTTGAQLNNTAVTEVFEPGSTAKVVTLAAALEEGVAEPGSKFVIGESLTRKGKDFRDSHVAPNPNLTLAGVIAQSSNIGTILAGEEMDEQTVYDYERKFGFGEKTGLPLPGESAGLVYPPEEYTGATQRFTVLFGQGLSVTAVQATSVFATIANDGVRVQPSLVQGWTSPDGSYTPAAEPTSTRVVSGTTARTMRDMLQAVVGDEGTAAQAGIDGYLVAGKTGTAQRYNDECRCYSGYTASFIGMAPADDPQLIVGVFLQAPTRTYYGGAAAGPVFKDVMTYALNQRRIPPSSAAPANLPLTW